MNIARPSLRNRTVIRCERRVRCDCVKDDLAICSPPRCRPSPPWRRYLASRRRSASRQPRSGASRAAFGRRRRRPAWRIRIMAASDYNVTAKLRGIPGAANALSYIKFDFPNYLRIYLHDTAEKRLFSCSERVHPRLHARLKSDRVWPIDDGCLISLKSCFSRPNMASLWRASGAWTSID